MEDDGDDKDDTKRRTRNLGEKKRRDQFNMLLNELSTMVSTNNRKMDKSTVLKSTISFLKNHNDVTVRSRAHDVKEDWKPPFLSNEEFTYLVLEALEGFVMVFSASGRVHYVSESVTSVLGHNSGDVINMSIFELIHEDDRPHMYAFLQTADPMQFGRVKDNEIRFQCHMKKGTLDFREENFYEIIQFCGYFRTSKDLPEAENEPGRQNTHDSRLLFVCTGRPQTPQLVRDVTLVDLNRNEFTSRHSLEWKFLFLDHRAPPIIGYLPFEVLGTSGYDYYHFDDLEKVVTCHEALMQKGELTSCYYRFLTKGQQWIWLQTIFYITYHQWNSKPEFVVCTHRVVSYADIRNDMKQELIEAETGSEVDPHGLATEVIDEAPPSPSCMSEASDAFTNYQQMSQASSLKSISAGSTVSTALTTSTLTTAPTWRQHPVPPRGSDTGSFSGESRNSQPTSSRDNFNEEPALLAQQHGMGAQYLQPSPYGNVVSAVVPASALPVFVTSDQAQLQLLSELPRQEQLQRKHEELQQMIMQQQAELRQVKEQLVLARLGMLPPIVNVPHTYMGPEDMQNQNQQIVYETPRAAITEYPAQQPPPPPHPHPHMPQ